MFNSSQLLCKVCGEPARCKHFGAISCRACAAFFRRAVGIRILKSCKNGNLCNSFKKGCFLCKYCRLQKCFAIGMSSENFQFERDKYKEAKFPQTMDTFCGKSNLIVFCAPNPDFESNSPEHPRTVLNLQFLLDEISKIVKQGPSTPVLSRTKLEKLALGLQQVSQPNTEYNPSDPITFGKSEAMAQLQQGILKFTKWLTYFEDFQKLPQNLQIQMLQGTWSIWNRLHDLASTALNIKRKISRDTIRKMKKDTLIFKLDPLKLDTSWLSKHNLEELKFFIDIPTEIRLDELTRAMIELEPSDVELSFMLGQLCFHYVGKRFQRETLCVAEKFQEVLANDLHDYYINEMKMPKYSKRLSNMMKINNSIQEEVFKKRSMYDLAIVFDIFCVDVSHPDLFLL